MILKKCRYQKDLLKPHREVHKAIRNHEHPNSCWESFEVRIFRNATYDTYKEALKKSQVAVETSDFDNEESRETRKMRCRRKMSSSSSDEESINLNIASPPRLGKKSVIPTSQSVKQNESNLPCRTDKNDDSECKCCPLHKNELISLLTNVVNELREIYRKNNLTRSVATEAIGEIKRLSSQLKERNEQSRPLAESSLNEHFLFPISTTENFEELERYLSDSSKFNSAVTEISKIGGSDVYDFIRRSLSWVAKNSLLMLYTWHGTKEKKGLNLTNVGQLIIKAAERTPFFSDRKAVEESVKKYLRRAKERSVYEKKLNLKC